MAIKNTWKNRKLAAGNNLAMLIVVDKYREFLQATSFWALKNISNKRFF